MVSAKNSALSDTAKKLSRNIIINPDRCGKDDMDDILRHDQTPRFLTAFTLPPLSTSVKKIGKTHGFIVPKNITQFIQLQPDDEVQLLMLKPRGEKRSCPVPTPRQLESIYEKYGYYFRFQDGVTLSDFDFNQVGDSFYLPIYTRLRVNGTSYAFYVTLNVLKAFGFTLGDYAELIIQKVSK